MQSKSTLTKYRQDTIKRALRYVAEEMSHYTGDADKQLSNPQAARDIARLTVGASQHELFAVLFLDNKHCLIESEVMFTGTIDGATVHPREVVKRALYHNASAVIFTHNHPAGNPEPSRADENITTKLQSALSMVDIRTLDHLVIGDGRIVSFAERGLL